MNETIHSIFLNNISAYNDAVKTAREAEELKRDTVNDINAYFYIVTCMRVRYGCPTCGSMLKCPCKVLDEISKHVNWPQQSDNYPEILW